MSDPIKKMRDVTPKVEDDPVLLRNVRNNLMGAINESASKKSRSKWLIPAVGIVGFLGVASAAGASGILNRVTKITLGNGEEATVTESDDVIVTEYADGSQLVEPNFENGAETDEGIEETPFGELASLLNKNINDECLSLDDAAVAANETLEEIGVIDVGAFYGEPEEDNKVDVTDGSVEIQQFETKDQCTTAELEIGGMAWVVLHGPAHVG